jgi:hypothetical protein
LVRGNRGRVRRYTREDIAVLAALDEAHGPLSGPATRKLLDRACYDFDDRQYQRLAVLSVAQLYRLRQSRAYRQRRVAYQPTRPTAVSIGERRKPEPNGRPGHPAASAAISSVPFFKLKLAPRNPLATA